ncbi:hypothetical protein BC830DRAFT_1225380 [Chytriomyces sp. MP71]|nr:hypothetical protein BC830DRAFT_1225380 [Chytriomyces sp. MP71]
MIVSAAILPHGTMVLDPTKRGLPEGAEALHNACVEAARAVAHSQPETVLVLTPHGIALSRSAGVVLGPAISGDCEWNGNWTDFKVSAIVSSMGLELVAHLQNDGLAAEGIQTFSRLSCPVRWGEAVPIHFMQSQLPHANYLIVSPPIRGKLSSQADVDARISLSKKASTAEPQNGFSWRPLNLLYMQFGASLFAFLHSRPERIAVVISGDLSHAHSTSCRDPLYLPDPNADLPVNDAVAQLFDAQIQEWIETRKRDLLFKDAASNVKDALVCGYDGFVWLQSGFDWLKEAKEVEFYGRVLANRHPTYYGMLVAVFE